MVANETDKSGRSVHCFPQDLEPEVDLGISNPLLFISLHRQAAMAVAGDTGAWGWGSPQRRGRGWGVLASKASWVLALGPHSPPHWCYKFWEALPHMFFFHWTRVTQKGRFSERGKTVWLFMPKVVALCAEQPLWALATAVCQPVPSFPDMPSERVQLFIPVSHWKGCPLTLGKHKCIRTLHLRGKQGAKREALYIKTDFDIGW